TVLSILNPPPPTETDTLSLHDALPILQSQQHRLFVQQRRNKIDKIGIGSRLNRDDHQIARTNFFGRIVAIDRRDSKILAFATHDNGDAEDFAHISAHQQVDVSTVLG